MKNIGLIRWNAQQLNSIKRDILIFDELVHDLDQIELWGEFYMAGSKMHPNHDENLLYEINSTIEYLDKHRILSQIRGSDLITSEQAAFVVTDEILEELYQLNIHQEEAYEKSINIIKSIPFDSPSEDYTEALRLWASNEDLKLRFYKTLLAKINTHQKFYPVLQHLTNHKRENQEIALQVTIDNLPTPGDIVPLDEIIDFKKQNHLKYKRLFNWINKLGKSDMNQIEMEQELEYLTLEFENRMKLEKENYTLNTLEAIITFPLEIIENLIKINWSKVPKQFLRFKKNNINLLIAETKAKGNEIAYINVANQKFK